MASKITQFYDKQTEEDLYPVTHMRAVRDDNGTNLETTLQNLQEDIEDDAVLYTAQSKTDLEKDQARKNIGIPGIATASDFTNRTTAGDAKVPTVGAICEGFDDQNNPQTGYYVCETESTMNAKVVVAANYMLVSGGSIKIKMSHKAGNYSNNTLNINNTGAKKIYYQEAEVSPNNTWADGEIVEVYYDPAADSGDGAFYANKVKTHNIDTEIIQNSTNPVMGGAIYLGLQSVEGKIQQSPQHGYYVCTTDETTNPKLVTAEGYTLQNGGSLKIRMEHKHNSYSYPNPTLNINGKGAKAIYYRGTLASRTNTWKDGELLDVYYDPTADNGNGAFYANTVGGNIVTDDTLNVNGTGFLPNSVIAKKFVSIYDEHTESVSLDTQGIITLQYAPAPGTTVYIYAKHSSDTLGEIPLRFRNGTTLIEEKPIFLDNWNTYTIPSNCTNIALYIGSTWVSSTATISFAVYEGELHETNNSINSLSKEFDVFSSLGNLFDKTKVKWSVALNSSGEEYSNVSRVTTDFIPVIAGETLIYSRYMDGAGASGTVTQYDSNKNRISYFNYGTNGGVLDASAAFIRIDTSIADIDKTCAYYGSNIFNKRRTHKELNGTLTDSSLIQSDVYKEESVSENLYNPNTLFAGITLAVDGTITTSANYSISDKIFVAPLVYYYSNVLGCIYDANDNVVGYFDPSSARARVKIPSNGVYVRLTVRNTDNPVFLRQNSEFITSTPSPIPAFVGRNYINSERLNLSLIKDFCKDDLNQDFFAGKKLAIDGDSISHDSGQYNYWQFVVANCLKMQLVSSTFVYDGNTYTIGSRGIAGSSIAKGEGETVNPKNVCISSRYSDLPSDADVIIIAGGTNDWAHDVIDMGQMSDRTDVTFYGAMHVLCLGLINRYPDKLIVFMTPIKRGGNLDAVSTAKGYKLVQFANAIKEVCAYYGIPVCDMFNNCTMNPSISVQKQLYFLENDDTHPNTYGQYKMGTTVTGFLRSLV